MRLAITFLSFALVFVSAIIQIFVDPRITKKFIWKSLLCMGVFAAHIAIGACTLMLISTHLAPDQRNETVGWAMMAFFGWLGLGFFGLLRHVPRLEDPPKWMMHFGVPDYICFAAIGVGLFMTLRVFLS